MTATCPKCGFSYGWDGAACRHCNPPEPDPAEQTGAGTTGRPGGWLDRVAALVVFPAIGVAIGVPLAGLLAGWAAFRGFLAAAVLGGDGGDAAGTVLVHVLAGLALGVLGGLWFAWELTFRVKPRRRRSP